MIVTSPYVAFAVTALFLGGLAYSSFANLGVLTRQKSLLIPFMLLLPCLPVFSRSTPPPNSSRVAGRSTSDGAVAAVVTTQPVGQPRRVPQPARLGPAPTRIVSPHDGSVDDIWD